MELWMKKTPSLRYSRTLNYRTILDGLLPFLCKSATTIFSNLCQFATLHKTCNYFSHQLII